MILDAVAASVVALITGACITAAVMTAINYNPPGFTLLKSTAAIIEEKVEL